MFFFFTILEVVLPLSLSQNSLEKQSKSDYNKPSLSLSSHNSKTNASFSKIIDHSPLSARVLPFYSLGLSTVYGFRYASNYDSYVSYPLDVDVELDSSFHDVNFLLDGDLDVDLDEIDLDLDLLQLKYGLYGLNHYSLHNPRFNDYRFRRRYRLHRKPYFRTHHRYFPHYWKQDFDFWGLDNYGLGFDYDKYFYTSSFLL